MTHDIYRADWGRPILLPFWGDSTMEFVLGSGRAWELSGHLHAIYGDHHLHVRRFIKANLYMCTYNGHVVERRGFGALGSIGWDIFSFKTLVD